MKKLSGWATFEDMYALYMSLRSPFARRVRLLLEELELEYTVETLNVFEPPPGYDAVNPLGRVPVLRLPNHEFLVDSNQIADYLRARFATHAIFAAHGVSEARHRTATGLAVGIMECAVGAFLEKKRAPGKQVLESFEEWFGSVTGALAHLERELVGPHLFGEPLGAWDLDLGAALAYVDLRLGREVVDRYPRLRAYLSGLAKRPSFARTVPPP